LVNALFALVPGIGAFARDTGEFDETTRGLG
jgi:hypothetical protein